MTSQRMAELQSQVWYNLWSLYLTQTCPQSSCSRMDSKESMSPGPEMEDRGTQCDYDFRWRNDPQCQSKWCMEPKMFFNYLLIFIFRLLNLTFACVQTLNVFNLHCRNALLKINKNHVYPLNLSFIQMTRIGWDISNFTRLRTAKHDKEILHFYFKVVQLFWKNSTFRFLLLF